MHIHNSHTLLLNSYNTECRHCWSCSCHSSDMLAKPCLYSVEVESPSTTAVQTVSRQAGFYGEQVRLLEDAGLEKDRAKIRKAWTVFLNQLGLYSSLRAVALTAYRNAYGQ